jgi:hypothetical protein
MDCATRSFVLYCNHFYEVNNDSAALAESCQPYRASCNTTLVLTGLGVGLLCRNKVQCKSW